MQIPKDCFGYLEKGTPIAAKISATLENHSAWVSVYELSEESYRFSFAEPFQKYVIRYMEFSEEILRLYREDKHDLDYDSATTYEKIFVNDENELEKVLSRWIKDFNELGPPWKSSCPL